MAVCRLRARRRSCASRFSRSERHHAAAALEQGDEGGAEAPRGARARLRRDGKGVGQPGADFRAEPLLVPKGTRKVIDYTTANPFMQKDPHPVPNMLEQMDKFKGKVFSQFDMGHGFYSITLDEDSRKFTAFRASDGGLHQFKRLPMEVRPAIPIFARVVEQNLIARLPAHLRDEVARYVDDLGHASEGETRLEEIDREIDFIEAIARLRRRADTSTGARSASS